MSTFKLPDLGEGLSDAEIVSWHVAPGDHVVADQPLVSVETDKAVVEIPSPKSGHISKLFAEPGEVVEIGADLVEFDDDKPADPGAIVGKLPDEKPAIRATPAVRRLAAKLNVDLTEINGTGPQGSITASDVEQAGKPQLEGVTIERITGVRRAMVQSMTKSGSNVVPATVMDEADINHWPSGTDITIRLARAIQAAVTSEPSLNAWYYPEKNERWLHTNINLGLAIDTAQGLFAPVLRDVSSSNDSDLRKQLQSLRKGVEDRNIEPEKLHGQTISLSNFGMIGGQHAALVIVPPQVAILGAGRISERLVMDGKNPVAHKVLPLSLTFDHRVVTGGEAARFMAAVVNSLEEK